MGQYEDLMDRLYAIHSEEDESRRKPLLDATVADDIEFYGLQVQTKGRAEFARNFRDGGTRLARTTPVEHRYGWLRCGWQLLLADGKPAAAADGRLYAGLQISQLTTDGRIRLIMPFLGLTPPEA